MSLGDVAGLSLDAQWQFDGEALSVGPSVLDELTAASTCRISEVKNLQMTTGE
jgi:hypothetical protein